MTAAALECTELSGGWGTLTAFREVNLSAEPGTIHAVLGPNGAGKTTLMLTIAGLLPAQSGRVMVEGASLPSGRPTVACRAGIVLVPDNRQLFTTLSVEDNLRVAHRRGNPEPKSMLDAFPELEPRWKLEAGALSGGEQQMLAIARAFIQRPKVLLVDECSMGLAPTIVERLFTTIRRLATETGCAVVIVEQYVHLALELADSVSVLNRGRVALTGAAADVAANADQLEEAYLGDDS